MTPIIALVLGVLIGWLVEWVIDWIYWRRRYQSLKDSDSQAHQNLISLDREVASLKAANAQAKQEIQALQTELNTRQQAALALQEELDACNQGAQALRTRLAVPPLTFPDNLEEINGIGPVIAKKLNQSGVYTFEQLAAQTPAWLRSTLGTVIERLADEESLLQQARQFAERKARQAADQK